jgi:hypothetical protein
MTLTQPEIATTAALPQHLLADDLVEGGITDAELEAIAMSAPLDDDPDALIDPSLFRRSGLPAAYLPGAMPGPHSRWMAVVALLLVAAFLTITMLGFCVTYGQISFA